MPTYKYSHLFVHATDRAKGTVQHQNKPPTADQWGTQDDTLDRQAGHGICKGLATAWVIAFLNGVQEAYTLDGFAQYLELLKFQGTYIKDYGGAIDAHLIKLLGFKVNPGLKFIKKISPETVDASQLPGYNFGCYASVWKHDIAFGRRSGRFYIMEPNFGLFAYDTQSKFLGDLCYLVEARRQRKHKGAHDTIGLWFYSKS